MKKRKDTIDQRLVRALAHPLRVQILEILGERVASPNWLSEELETGLTHVAYHTRTLRQVRLPGAGRDRAATWRDRAFLQGLARCFHRRPRLARGAAFPARRRSPAPPCRASWTGHRGPGSGHDRRPRRHHAQLDADASGRPRLGGSDGDHAQSHRSGARRADPQQPSSRHRPQSGRSDLHRSRPRQLRDRRFAPVLVSAHRAATGPGQLGPLLPLSYSHSIVAGGFEEMSRATRLTSRISLMIRLETRSSRS